MFVPSCLFWLCIAFSLRNTIATAVLPLLHWETKWLAADFVLLDFRIVPIGMESAFDVVVATRNAAGAFPAGTHMDSSTMTGNLLQPLILMFSIITTGWLLQRRKLAALLALSIPLALAVLALDVPFVLIGALQDLIDASANTTTTTPSLFVMWMNFLNGGGRLALGICAAAISLATIKERTK